MDPIETLEHEGRTVHILHELDGELCDPRDGDNFCHLYLFGKAKSYGDQHDLRSEDYSGWDAMQAALVKANPGGIVKPVYVFDHSGIALATTDFWFRQWDSQGWDWCQVGFAVVSADEIRANFLRQRISKKLRAKAEEVLDAEVKVQGQYVSGECYCWDEVDADGEVVDSCTGYVGIENVREAAKMHLGL